MSSAVRPADEPFLHLRRGLVFLTCLALAWAVLLDVTGGFVLSRGWLHISSRSARNPLLLAVLALAATWALGPGGRRGRALLAAWEDASGVAVRRFNRTGMGNPAVAAPAAAGCVAVALVAIGLVKGAHVAGGADSYGYVSQAHMWATGTLRGAPVGSDVLPPGISSDALLPLGYLFTPDGAALVPMYAPGLPMQMALFESPGGPGAVFYVMPLLAGVAVWATYALGTCAGGRRVGVAAAVLLAASPTVLFQVTHAPMSDLPAAAWWTVALAALVRPSRPAALLCGLATGAAILTRPNLVPLAVIPGAPLLWSAVRSSGAGARDWQRLALFAAGSVPACAAVAALNAYWYGSPLVSGYGDIAGTMYRWDHFWPNAPRYADWMLQTQGPAVALAALAPVVFFRADGEPAGDIARTRRVVAISALFVVTVWLSYAFYLPFGAWWTLRFLLPAFPAFFVVVSATLFRAGGWLPASSRGLAIGAVLAVALWWSLGFAGTHGALESGNEWRFATIGRYLQQHAPRQSVVLAKHHSGSARYYANRLTIRWDYIQPWQLDAAVGALQRRGYSAFILLDDEEEGEFRTRFAGASRLAALDWPPEKTDSGAALYKVAPSP